MTKAIRIENADTSTNPCVVEVYENRDIDGKLTPVLVQTLTLNYPTEMQTVTIWKGRYLVIKEKE